MRLGITIENNHYKNLLYLPIISLDKWMEEPFIDLLIKENKNNIQSAFIQKLDNKLSYDAIFLLPDHIEDLFRSKFTKSSDVEKLLKYYKFLKFVKDYEKDNTYDHDLLEELKVLYDNERKSIIKKLFNNSYEAYYYLENIDYNEQQQKNRKNYVVLLTEVFSLPLSIKKEIENGIDLKKKSDLQVFFGNDREVFPLSTLRSPYIEHLIQSFVNLFRVGIDRADTEE